MYTIETLHHVGLPVTDIERSRKFYKEILNLTEIERPPFDFPGAWFQVGDRTLHLMQDTIENRNPTWRAGKGLDSRDIHFAIRVKSCGEMLKFLLDKGYDQNATDEFKKIKVNPAATAGFPQLYIMDPDRNMIEFNAAKADELLIELV